MSMSPEQPIKGEVSELVDDSASASPDEASADVQDVPLETPPPPPKRKGGRKPVGVLLIGHLELG